MSGDNVRAVRNNNPGNIVKGEPWQGLMPTNEMTPDQSAEQRFCVFKSPQWGFRAMAVTLITYYDARKAKDGSRIDTIAEVITRWAPPNENDTVAYIRAVEKAHVKGQDTIDMHNYNDLAPLVKAIAIHECGGWFFDDHDLEAGLRMAGVPPPAQALVQSRTVKAATVAGAFTSISVVADIVKDVQPLQGLVAEIAQFAPTVAGVLVLVFVGAIIYFRYDDWKREKR